MIVTRPITTNFGNLEHKPFVRHGLDALKLGQRLDAVVLADSSRGHVSLRIGNTVIQASTSIALQQNAHLMLEVVQKHPQLLLRLIPAAPDTATTGPLRDALVSLLPRQVGLAPSLAGLIQKGPLESRSPELAQLRSAIHKLVAAIPERNSLSRADGVRHAMVHSGLFLEALLARALGRSMADTSRDLKANLLRTQQILFQYLANAGVAVRNINTPVPHLYNGVKPPRKKALPAPQQRVPLTVTAGSTDTDGMITGLLTSTRGAVARLGLHQIVTAENFNSGEQMWQLELPVKHTDAVEIVAMTIEKEQTRSINDADGAWTVHLALDLPRLGPVQIRISHFPQGVSTCFWTDYDTTRTLIEVHLDRLKAKLQQHGVTSLNLSCLKGSPDQAAQSETDRSNIDFQV